MRAVIQRVKEAKVEVDGQVTGRTGTGLLVYLGIGEGDEEKDAELIADKLSGLRIFQDQAGKMNLSLEEVGGQILLVSNFTLYGDCRKGRRPSFDQAGKPELANRLYETVCSLIETKGIDVQKGVFGEYMQVSSVNDGPVTFLIDSTKKF